MALILDAPHNEAAMVILLLHTLLQVVLSFSGAIIQVDAESSYTHGPLLFRFVRGLLCRFLHSARGCFHLMH